MGITQPLLWLTSKCLVGTSNSRKHVQLRTSDDAPFCSAKNTLATCTLPYQPTYTVLHCVLRGVCWMQLPRTPWAGTRFRRQARLTAMRNGKCTRQVPCSPVACDLSRSRPEHPSCLQGIKNGQKTYRGDIDGMRCSQLGPSAERFLHLLAAWYSWGLRRVDQKVPRSWSRASRPGRRGSRKIWSSTFHSN